MSTRPRPTLVAAVVVGAVVALLVGLLATRSTGGNETESASLDGKTAPPIDGKAIRGEPFDITTSDQWVVVNFFATWCGPCVEEHPELVAFEREHTKTGDARVISVAFNENSETIARFFDAKGGDWTVVDGDEGRTAVAWGVAKVPESYLVSPYGVVVQSFRSGVTKAELDAVIDAYEQASSPTTTAAGAVTTTTGAGS